MPVPIALAELLEPEELKISSKALSNTGTASFVNGLNSFEVSCTPVQKLVMSGNRTRVVREAKAPSGVAETTLLLVLRQPLIVSRAVLQSRLLPASGREVAFVKNDPGQKWPSVNAR